MHCHMMPEINLMLVMFINIWDRNLVITVPADVLAPNGARPSAGTVMTTQTDMVFFPRFCGFQLFHVPFSKQIQVIGIENSQGPVSI